METNFKIEQNGEFFQGIFFLDGTRAMATILARTVEEALTLFEKCKSAIINGSSISGQYGKVYVSVLCEGDPMKRKFVGSVEGLGATEVDQLKEKLKFAVKQHIVKEAQMRDEGKLFK